MNQSIVKKLEGLQTISTIMKILKIKRSTAIKLMHKLRKSGYVKTSGGGKQPRFYRISMIKEPDIGNPGLYETINKYSRIKLAEPYKHRIIGNKLTAEEALVRAIDDKSIRVIISSLELFNHIKNWSLLYKYAKQYNARRKVGALYDAARLTIKVRKMNKRIYDRLLKTKKESKYIIKPIKSKDLKEIEKKWRIYLPFNKADLQAYEEW